MAKLNMAKLSNATPAASGGTIPPANSHVKSNKSKKDKTVNEEQSDEWRPGWDQPSQELADKLSSRNAEFKHPSVSPRKNQQEEHVKKSAPLPTGAVTPPLDDGSDEEDLLRSDDEVGSGDGVYDYQNNEGPMMAQAVRPETVENGSKKSTVRRTDALFYEAERRHVREKYYI